MRLDVLQAAAIALHGNAYLGDPAQDRPGEMLGSNSTLRNVFEIAFVRDHTMGRNQAGRVAHGVSPWLRRLRKEGVSSMRLLTTPRPRVASEDGEGPRWGLITDGDTGTELWRPTWHGKAVRFNEKPSWNVLYTSSRFSRWYIPEPPSIPNALDQLERSLLHCHVMASRLELSGVQDLVEVAMAHQRRGSTLMPGFTDLCPKNASNDIQRGVAAALRTLVILSASPWSAALENPEAGRFSESTDMLWTMALQLFESCAFDCAQPQLIADSVAS